jgi:hypothetical protein
MEDRIAIVLSMPAQVKAPRRGTVPFAQAERSRGAEIG